MSADAVGADFTPWPEEIAARYREAGYWPGESFGAWLRGLGARYGERTALISGETRITYAELDRQADRMAAHFAAHGLRRGDRVVVQLPNRAEFFSTVFGLMRLGAAPILALPAHRQKETAFFCQATGAAALVTVDQYAGFDHRELARTCQALAPTLRTVFVLGKAQEFTPLLPPAGRVPAIPVPDPGDVPASGVALYQLSGGSTGTPKLIPRTHDDYLYSVRASAEICGLNGETVYLAALPLAHNFPLSSPGTLGVLHAGGTVVIAPQPSPDVAFALIERHRVTMTALVPALLLVWLQAAPRTGHDLSTLRLLQVGGAPLGPGVARRVPRELGCDLQQVFGMAEGLVNYTRAGSRDAAVYETQGHPISPHDEIRVVDDHDRDVPDGVSGHLLTRGPYTIRGYFRAPEHNARAFTPDGYYRTGDLVTRRKGDGALVVTGRSKDQINRGGEKIAAEEVEFALLTHPLVHNAALVGYPDPWLGERSCAFVQLDAVPPPRLASDLRRHLLALGLAAYKVPDRIEFTQALPRTAFGKIDKPALRARLERERSPV